jgi:hypothetical protein
MASLLLITGCSRGEAAEPVRAEGQAVAEHQNRHTNLSYVPTYLTTRVVDRDMSIEVTERDGGGYDLVAQGPQDRYDITFVPAATGRPLTVENAGADAAWAAGRIDVTDRGASWTDDAGTVTIETSHRSPEDLRGIISAMVLVGEEAYQAFLSDPVAPIASVYELELGDLAGTLTFDGDLRQSQQMVLTGMAPHHQGWSPSLGVTRPNEVTAWSSGTGVNLLLRLPQGFGDPVFRGEARVVAKVSDPRFGTFLLLESPSEEPVEYTLEAPPGQEAYSGTIWCPEGCQWTAGLAPA